MAPVTEILLFEFSVIIPVEVAARLKTLPVPDEVARPTSIVRVAGVPVIVKFVVLKVPLVSARSARTVPQEPDTTTADEAMALELERIRVPLLSVVAPVKLLAWLRLMTPPFEVSAVVPEMALATVSDSLPLADTVMLGV